MDQFLTVWSDLNFGTFRSCLYHGLICDELPSLGEGFDLADYSGAGGLGEPLFHATRERFYRDFLLHFNDVALFVHRNVFPVSAYLEFNFVKPLPVFQLRRESSNRRSLGLLGDSFLNSGRKFLPL